MGLLFRLLPLPIIGFAGGVAHALPLCPATQAIVSQGPTLDPGCAPVVGKLYGLTAPVTTSSGTGEQTLGTYSLPANSLITTGQHLRIRAVFTKPANTDATTSKLYFGSEVISGGAVTGSGQVTVLEVDVYRTGPSAQTVTAWGQTGTSVVAGAWLGYATETETAAITVKATITDGTSAANDGVLLDLTVENLN